MPPNSAPVDQRIINLVGGNLASASPYQHLADRELVDAQDGDAEIPRAWRSWGYEPIAELIGAWTGRTIDTGTLRHSWRDDLSHGMSRLLPAPDAIIRRGPRGDLLPGWADKTIREWLSGRGVPCNFDTYLPWADDADEVDPRLIELIAGNQATRDRAFNDAEPLLVPWPTRDSPEIEIPAAYLALGYEDTAQLITKVQGESVKNTTVRHYWGTDLKRVHPKTGEVIPASGRMPIPDAVIGRGADPDLLPGWTQRTILDWLPTRQGSGNHTAGEHRRGFDQGRTGLTKVNGVWVRVEPLPV